jgi:transcriptional regulator with XRE-family HTH domain
MQALDEALKRTRERRGLPGPAERRLLRIQAGLTQRDIAQCLGTTAAAVSRYESGDRVPRGGILDRYLTILYRLMKEKTSPAERQFEALR